MSGLSHLDNKGRARMVDVGGKDSTDREARASSTVKMNPVTLKLVTSEGMPKGDVFGAARLAGIMAAKKTHELIPLCHPLLINSVEVQLEPDKESSSILITTKVKCTGKTGVEMEALTAATVAALTVYDMCKAVDKSIEITDIMLLEKKGGKSGAWKRK